jgi:eukaryotic-like serine/threonine-protein kinase
MSQSVLGERYQVEARIGAGGMAEVFRGFDNVLGRTVAIKMLLPQFARDAGFVARFRREAQAAARLNHPNIVAVYDTGADADTQYIVMEFIEGRTLHEFLSSGRKPSTAQAVDLAQKVAMALVAAHQQGVIHRDIKPANIMVTREGEVKVTDLGIARMETAETAPQTSAVLGTAAYLSPEQAQGQSVDARTDIYSLGTVLYELLSGRTPFTGDSPVAIAYKQVNETPVPPSHLNPDVSPVLDAVVMKALAKNRANRYQTAQEFHDDLERVKQGQEVTATPILSGAAAADATQVISRPQPTTVLPPHEEPPGSGRSAWAGVLIGLLIAAIVAGGGYLLYTSLNDDGADTTTVTVPNVKGLTFDEAKAELERANLTVVEPPLEEESDGRPGRILRQDPQPDVVVEQGAPVTLTVSIEPPEVSVPNLLGQDQSGAEAVIKGANLKVGSVTTEASDAPVGQVISQTPPAFEQVPEGSVVNFVLSSGPADVTVPDVICQPLGSALAELQRAGLEGQPAGTVPALAQCPNPVNVAQQSPASGTAVEPGSVVQLWQGEEAVESPTDSASEPPPP